MGRVWDRLIAARASGIKQSASAELDPYLASGDVITFTGGMPPIDRIPRDHLKNALELAWDRYEDAYAYGEPQGFTGLRERITELVAGRNVHADPEQVVVTNGSQQGLDIISRILFDPGDQLIVEAPTYFGALQIFDAYHVEYLTAPMDKDGLLPGELRKILESAERPKALYTVSTFQNPSGYTIAEDRRQAIRDLAAEFNILIIEDDPYGDLGFDGRTRPPLRAGDENVVYLGTFSKTIMPALRIGWMVLPAEIVPMAVNVKEAVDIQSDRILQRALVHATDDDWLAGHVEQSRSVYRDRCEFLESCLAEYMPEGTSWESPEGGFFLWLRLPDGMDAMDLVPVSAKEGVICPPGSSFYPDRRPSSHLRLGFTILDQERTQTGIRRLATAVRTLQ